MIALLFGLFFIVIGFMGLLRWFQDFLVVLRGLGPISVLIGGIIALMSGITSLRPPPTDDDAKE